MGKINSRDKGARYERKIAQMLREHGYEAERGCQERKAYGKKKQQDRTVYAK